MSDKPTRRDEVIEVLRAKVVMLRDALDRSHACATMDEDGECEGCFVTDALEKAALPPRPAPEPTIEVAVGQTWRTNAHGEVTITEIVARVRFRDADGRGWEYRPEDFAHESWVLLVESPQMTSALEGATND